MRRTLAAALACAAVMSAHGQQIQAPTRVTPYDWQCQDADGNKLSDHQREGIASITCLNNPAGAFIQGGRYRINRPSAPPDPEPPVCPAKPADESRTTQCPAGSTGNFTQTRAYESTSAPTCWTPGEWAPTSPPAGACNRAPTIGGTPIAAVVAGNQYTFQPAASDADGDTMGFTVTNRPTWATFDPPTGRLTGTPGTSHVGVHSSITITVSDGKASATTPAFSITVTAPPPPPLTAPSNLTGTAEPNATNPANSNVALTWDAVAGAASYSVERCAGPTCTSFAAIGGTVTATYLNSNLPPGSTLRYRVQAFTPQVGPYSSVVTVTTPTAPPPPPPPPVGSGTATLNWTAPTENTDGTPLQNLAGFRIEYGTVGPAGPGLSRSISVNNAGLSAYTVTDLTAGEWAFAVRAVSAVGRESELSDIVTRVVQ